MRLRQNPALGILPLVPLLIAGGTALTVAGGAVGTWWYRKENDKADWDKINLPVPKAAPTPSAPKTAQDMRTWSPQKQLEQDRATYSDWSKTATDKAVEFYRSSPDQSSISRLVANDDVLIVVAGAAVLAGLYLAFGGRR